MGQNTITNWPTTLVLLPLFRNTTTTTTTTTWTRYLDFWWANWVFENQKYDKPIYSSWLLYYSLTLDLNNNNKSKGPTTFFHNEYRAELQLFWFCCWNSDHMALQLLKSFKKRINCGLCFLLSIRMTFFVTHQNTA